MSIFECVGFGGKTIVQNKNCQTGDVKLRSSAKQTAKNKLPSETNTYFCRIFITIFLLEIYLLTS